MRRQIRAGDAVIPYEITFKRVHNINIRLHRDGSVHVSAPRRVPLELVDAFVSSKAAWIARHQAAMAAAQETPVSTVSRSRGDTLRLLGEEYPLEQEAGASAQLRIACGRAILTVPEDCPSDQALESALWQLCRQVLTQALEEVFPLFAPYGIAMPRCQIKAMKSRWGSCTPQRLRISLNFHLIHAPYPCIQYVAAHELAHLVQGNHGPGFYAVLDHVMPDHRARRQLLETSGTL